jgi:ribonuclease-3 family protein
MTLNLTSSTDPRPDVQMLSPLTLAFVGDTVYDLLVRERLVLQANRPTNKLHNLAVERVRASAQAAAAKMLLDAQTLQADEASVLRRGRNAHTGHVPKTASESDYHMATGLEALFGYLYLSGRQDRLRELFDLIVERSDLVSGESHS